MSLITLTDPRSQVSEAYRTLRTNLSFYSVSDPLRTLVITSPAPDTVADEAAANLAVTMAQSGKRTILVECNLRRPSLHTYFDLPVEPGLTDYILGDVKLPLLETAVENLFLLPAGSLPPNPADLLGSTQIDEIIGGLLQEVDIILFNAPPVISVTDATVLGAKVDGVLLVVQAGKTRRDHAQRAKEVLAKANVRIVGVTLTNAPKDGLVGNY